MTTKTQDHTHSGHAPPPKEYWAISRNFLTRYITALALLPLFILTMYAGGIVWAVLLAIPAMIGVLELYMLARGHRIQGVAIIGVPAAAAIVFSFYLEEPLLALGLVVASAALTFPLQIIRRQPPDRVKCTLLQTGTTVAGLFYVALPLAFLVAIRMLPNGFLWLVVICAMTWGTDTFAYFGGRMWGRRKLAPRLSPKKTVEGAVVGVIGGFVLSLLFLIYTGHVNPTTVAIIAVGPFVAVAGDLLESAIKRAFKVKDSFVPGLNIIPGHGGVLDRIDALLLVTAYTYAALSLTGVTG